MSWKYETIFLATSFLVVGCEDPDVGGYEDPHEADGTDSLCNHASWATLLSVSLIPSPEVDVPREFLPFIAKVTWTLDEGGQYEQVLVREANYGTPPSSSDGCFAMLFPGGEDLRFSVEVQDPSGQVLYRGEGKRSARAGDLTDLSTALSFEDMTPPNHIEMFPPPARMRFEALACPLHGGCPALWLEVRRFNPATGVAADGFPLCVIPDTLAIRCLPETPFPKVRPILEGICPGEVKEVVATTGFPFGETLPSFTGNCSDVKVVVSRPDLGLGALVRARELVEQGVIAGADYAISCIY